MQHPSTRTALSGISTPYSDPSVYLLGTTLNTGTEYSAYSCWYVIGHGAQRCRSSCSAISCGTHWISSRCSSIPPPPLPQLQLDRMACLYDMGHCNSRLRGQNRMVPGRSLQKSPPPPATSTTTSSILVTTAFMNMAS